MLLLIDNYDSFTYNLYQYLSELGVEKIEVVRNDQMTVDELEAMKPERIVVSPGPSRPENAGVSVEAIKRFAGVVPILGVCLGHQCLADAFGGVVVHAGEIMHGKTSRINHDGKGVFAGVPDRFEAVRYHSLAIDSDSVPDELEVVGTASSDGTIMAVRHREFPVFGLQFHPESVLTADGKTILQNFLECHRVSG